MSQEKITIEVDSDSLVDEICRLIKNNDLSSSQSSRIEDLFEKDDPHLSDFSDTEIAEYFMKNECYYDLETEDVYQICEGHDIKFIDESETTLRDEQYEELFEELKQKYSIAQLRSFLT